MPGRKKKKFIDKKNAVTFDLVHRSQRDPLQADDEAPQHVLLPTEKPAENDGSRDQKEEERKFGVFFDDGYDYLQHLKDVEELNDVGPTERFRVTADKPQSQQNEPRLTLPSSVFASAAETEVGLLNKAAPISGPRLDMDPDIVAGMDEDFDFDNPDNQLEDDFMLQANDGLLPEDMEEDAECDHRSHQHGDDDEDFAEDERIFKPFVAKSEEHIVFGGSTGGQEGDEDLDVASDEADMSDDDEGGPRSDLGSLDNDEFDTKTRFTSYSMTSSVVRRNAGLTLLDDRFEKMYEQYDDTEIGPLDHEDIEGCVKPNSDLLNAALDEFEKHQQKPKLKDVVKPGRRDSNDEIHSNSEEESSESDDDDEDLVKMKFRKPEEKWDCESILSTRSTLYNHPTLISEPRNPNAIRLTKRAEIPADILPTRGLTLRQIEAEYQNNDVVRANTNRSKSETLTEKKDRKEAVRLERKMRREEKKVNKTVFKQEKIRQHKEHISVKQNLAGMAIT